jgi:hypothetical protein
MLYRTVFPHASFLSYFVHVLQSPHSHHQQPRLRPPRHPHPHLLPSLHSLPSRALAPSNAYAVSSASVSCQINNCLSHTNPNTFVYTTYKHVLSCVNGMDGRPLSMHSCKMRMLMSLCKT